MVVVIKFPQALGDLEEPLPRESALLRDRERCQERSPVSVLKFVYLVKDVYLGLGLAGEAAPSRISEAVLYEMTVLGFAAFMSS